MGLDSGNRPTWKVLTPPLEESKYQGKMCTLYDQRTRHVMLNAVADGILEAGVFIVSTGAELYGATQVAKPTSTGGNILGLTIKTPAFVMGWNDTLKCFTYADGKEVSYADKGDWYVYSEVAVNAGQPVYFRHTVDSSLNRIGAVSNVTGTGKDLHPTAKFLETISAPGLVAIKLD